MCAVASYGERPLKVLAPAGFTGNGIIDTHVPMNITSCSRPDTLCRIQATAVEVPLPKSELLAILGPLLEVRFVSDDHEDVEIAGEIVVSAPPTTSAAVGSDSSMSLSVAHPRSLSGDDVQTGMEVTFADSPNVPLPFRGRVVSTRGLRGRDPLTMHENEQVLASSREGPIWTLSYADGRTRFRSAWPLPRMSPEMNFGDVFNEDRFMHTLPLLHFLRSIIGPNAYQAAPSRAAFMIDDPNLHWPRYGYVDFQEIAVHAEKENYHVSFATIPIDTWFTHAATANIFWRNPRWLSLLVHGNNHGRNELARKYSGDTRKALLQQANWRIERLERKANLHVARVMVPPHGACSSEMLAELPRRGFESACISAGSLRAHNQNKPWTKTLGFLPAEIVEGCAVLPRWGLTRNVRTTLLLAAYLGQPMIIRGHHQDLKHGLAVFDELAGFINGLGNVMWTGMTNLSRLSYLWRMEGTICRVRPLGMKVAFELPANATHLVIDSFRASDDPTWKFHFADGFASKLTRAECLPLRDRIDRRISIEHAGLPLVDARPSGHGATNPGLVLRRLLTETRDRLQASYGVVDDDVAYPHG